MNRQAIVFLTMFSLVLMLAVYYVTMPIEVDSETPVSTVSNSLIDIQNALDSKRKILLEDYTAIIASNQSSTLDKSKAMEQMDQLNKIINIEKDYQKVVQELGYSDCAIEIENDIMRISILKNDSIISDASKIIKTVLVKSNYEYIPEVSFIE